MIVIGHRGACGHAPEHTFASWDRALSLGVDYLEQDLQMTRDGELIVMHDATLDRTTSGTGPVIDHALAHIQSLDAGSWFDPGFAGERVPTLRQVFERYGTRTNYYIETKTPEDAPGMEEKLLALVGEFGLREDAGRRWPVLVQSFSTPSLLKIKQLDPGVPLIQLLPRELSSDAIRRQLPDISRYAVGIGPAHTSVDEALIDTAHDAGLVVHPYTVNDATQMRRLVALGADGMFTDYPDRLNAVLGRDQPKS